MSAARLCITLSAGICQSRLSIAGVREARIENLARILQDAKINAVEGAPPAHPKKISHIVNSDAVDFGMHPSCWRARSIKKPAANFLNVC